MSRPPVVVRITPDALNPSTADVRGRGEGRHADASREASGSESRLPPEPLVKRWSADDSSLDDFASEQDRSVETESPAETGRSGLTVALFAIAGIIVVGGLAYVATGGNGSVAPAAATAAVGQAQFESLPAGADVVVDGEVRGQTPLKLTLPVGRHSLEFRRDGVTRTLPLTIESGMLVSQYVELNAPVATAVGGLEIVSDPPGAQVSLDGVAKGVTPLKIDDVEARDHIVSLTRAGATVYRTVPVQAGATATVSVAMASAAPAPGAVGGFLSFALPFEAQVFEGGRLIGSTRTDRLMIPTGRHEVELVNSALQFRTNVTVNITPGRVTSPAITIPEGSLSINALPWADVSIDGREVGTTPLQTLLLNMRAGDALCIDDAARESGLSEDLCRTALQALTRVGLMNQESDSRFVRCTLDLSAN